MSRSLRGLAILVLATCCSSLNAQDYPGRPVRMLVPYAAGGALDVFARLIGQRISETLGQQFVVENRPGAGGISATEAVAKAAADGYTLLVADIPQLAINPFLFLKLPYDPVRDFAPVSLIATIPNFLVVQPSLRVNSLAEFIALAKAKPGQFNYGSAGIGSLGHIAMESIKAPLGLDIVHVPYKGSSQSVPAFLAGDLTMLITTLAAVAPYIKAGKGKPLAVTSLGRSLQAPDVPTVSEVLPGYSFAGEIGVLAPAGTPPAVVSKLSGEIAKALKHPDVMQRLIALDAAPVGNTPEAYAENIRRNLERFEKAVKISGLKAE